jgi:hypothetical protein
VLQLAEKLRFYYDGGRPQFIKNYMEEYVSLNTDDMKNMPARRFIRVCEAAMMLPQKQLWENPDFSQKMVDFIHENEATVLKWFAEEPKTPLDVIRVVDQLSTMKLSDESQDEDD